MVSNESAAGVSGGRPLAIRSIHPDDVTTLREVGQRIREHGLPEATDALAPDAGAL